MSRPSPGSIAPTLTADQQKEHAADLAALDDALEREDWVTAQEAIVRLRAGVGESRYLQELEWSLAPDAYWRQATWRRLVAIFAGPAINLVFAFVLFTALYMVASDRNTNVIGQVLRGSPAAAAGLHGGDRVLTIAGSKVKPDDIPARIRATRGAPFRIGIERSGKHASIGPLRAKPTDGAYRIGIAIEVRTGPGYSLPTAARKSLGVGWSVTADTVRGLAHLATGRDTNQVSSSVGIVRVQSQAWRAGARDFLSVLGLISLALGLMNLIPVLPLDGGHIVLALVEKVRGRTFAQSVYIRYSVVGLSLFALLMYFGLRNDLFGSGG